MDTGALTREAIVAALEAFERSALDVSVRTHAAVAVAIGTAPDGTPALVFTLRSDRLRAHPSQFALPGGGIDPGESPEDAALRELHEELGIDCDDVLGRLDDYATRSGYLITPVVVWIGDQLAAVRPNPDEVAMVLEATIPEVDVEPRFVRIPESVRPVVQWPFRGHLIHAPTAAIVYQFREVVCRRRPTRVADLEQPVFAWR